MVAAAMVTEEITALFLLASYRLWLKMLFTVKSK